MALADIPDLSEFCIEITSSGGETCIRFPGGATLCAQFGVDTGDLGAITRSALASVNAGLTPLTPFFNVMDVLVAAVNCIQAIPDAISRLSPAPILDCVPDLISKLEKLLALIPQLSVPALIADILELIIIGLLSLKNELQAMLDQQARLLAAATKAAETGNVQLQTVIDCATGNLDAQLVNKNAGLAPLNRLIGVMNVLCKLAGLGEVPTLENLGELTEDILLPLDASIQALETVRSAIPV